jgi:hypothetical protein
LPVAARVDPTLSLPHQAAANLAAVRSVLAAADIDVWQVPANVARPMLAVRGTDRDRVVGALDHPDLVGWYRDRLDRRNRRELRLERPHAPLPGAVRGIVLWPYVVADPALTFRSDQQQGVAVTFWTAEVGEPDALRSDDEETVPVPAGVDLRGYDSAQDSSDEDERVEPSDAELVNTGPIGIRGTATPAPVTPTADTPTPITFAPDNPPEATAWRCPVRNGALEVVSAAEIVGLRGDVPPSARGHHLARVGFDVDVVYTWVDGSDPIWRARKLAAQQAADGTRDDHTERALDEVRFADHDELRHSLRSIEQFAPWVRHVWLVTGGQRPGWLAEHPRLSVVDHTDIWPDRDGLPSFNSHAIESCLHRIEGLSEHFLYLNDDMILGRPVRPERFFHGNGVPKFFWSNALVDYLPVVAGEIASTAAAKNARRLVARECGVTFSRKFFHAPYPLRVSVLHELEERFGPEFAATRRAPFRTVEDIAAAGSLYFNYAYATGRSVPGQLGYAYIDPAGEGGRRQLQRLLRRRNVDSFCLNDGHTEQGDEERELTDLLVREFLAAYLPVPSNFERGPGAGLPVASPDGAAVTGA